MSNINGEGFGSSHDWQHLGSNQWSQNGGVADTTYKCKACEQVFHHYYHDEPNIFQALESASDVTDKCPNKKKGVK